MQIRGTSGVQTTTQVNFANRIQSTETSNVATQIDTTDQVDISNEARMLAGLNENTEIRADRVAEIRQQIETGQYETTEKLETAVDRLLDELA